MANAALCILTILMVVVSGATDDPINITTPAFPTATQLLNTTVGVMVVSCNDIFIAVAEPDVPVIVCFSICLVLGLLLVFAGFRCFKCSMFLMGFLYASIITYIISIDHSELSTWSVVGVSLAVGVFCGLLTAFVIHCGLFLCGVSVGLDIGLTVLIIISVFYIINNQWITFGILVALSLIFALLALKWQKIFTILATATVGGALFAAGADYFVEEFVLVRYMLGLINAESVQVLCIHTWFMLGIWPVMFILGCVVQLVGARRDIQHKKRKNTSTLEAGDRAMKRYKCLNRSADVVTKPYNTQLHRESDADEPEEI